MGVNWQECYYEHETPSQSASYHSPIKRHVDRLLNVDQHMQFFQFLINLFIFCFVEGMFVLISTKYCIILSFQCQENSLFVLINITNLTTYVSPIICIMCGMFPGHDEALKIKYNLNDIFPISHINCRICYNEHRKIRPNVQSQLPLFRWRSVTQQLSIQ